VTKTAAQRKKEMVVKFAGPIISTLPIEYREQQVSGGPCCINHPKSGHAPGVEAFFGNSLMLSCLVTDALLSTFSL